MTITSLDAAKLEMARQLLTFSGVNHEARKECQKVLAFLEKVDNPFTRRNLSGHITASGWIVNKSMTKTLLIFHPVLKIWIQPGGHVEMGERPEQASCREVLEETGIAIEQPESPVLFNVDVHPIPENPIKREPEHLHYDLCYWLVAETEGVAPDLNEVEQARWFELDVIVNIPEKFEPSIVRLAKRSLEHSQA